MTSGRSPSNGRAPLRVLLSLPDKRVRGGPPSHLYLLHDSLKELGVDVRKFIYGGRTHDESALRKAMGRLLDLARFPFLIAKHRPDVVQFNSAFDRKGVMRDVFFIPVARALGRTVITKFHGSDLKLLATQSALWRLLTWIVVRGSHTVCVLSHQEARAFSQRFPRQRLSVVKNALDFSRYARRDDFRRRYGVPADKSLLLFVARFIPAKGLTEVLQALPIIRRRHDVHVLLVGDGPSRGESQDLCRQLSIEPYVTYTGYIPEDETVGAYLASDILVFPSYHEEGMPMVIWHSLACGLPIITTRIRAAADWLEEGRHGLFVPPRDAKELARVVVKLLDDAELRTQMGRNGPILARKFERSLVAREYLSLYESMSRRESSGTVAETEAVV